ncbi:hypothetical protein BJ138DRAFT_1019694 [Hygrophoropsis aurantiaca]|uniref:Uncharacterized protein n=1 Tax=Hygrophoropsis aurantiaca TaxID=72124 RepID=A0ACB7ZSB0_9AGAM|nr:hypothetical protein BJ138DRAFT_1019694 [Hygrophoropsis aurantiaca]
MSYAAEFTTDGDKSHTCEKCRTEFPPEIKLFYMQSIEKRKPGRWLCAQCHDYYLAKPTTHRVPSGKSSESRWPNNGYQRCHSAPTDCRGSTWRYYSPFSFVFIQLIFLTMNMAFRKGCPTLALRTPHPTNSGPNITIYGQTNFSQPAELSNFLAHPPVSPGYQEAHKSYQDMCNYLARQAYASNGVEVIVVKAYLMVRAPGKKAASLVSNIMESIGNVPVHIGANHLKTIVYVTLQPLFLKWSKGLSFTFEEVRLRHKTWEEILPCIVGDDIDAISAFFFPQSGKGKSKFNPGRGIEVHLELPYEKYTDAQDHRVHPAQQLQGHSLNLPGPGNLNRQQPSAQEFGRASGSQLEAVQQPDVVDSQSSVPVQSFRPLTDVDRSPSIEKRKLSIVTKLNLRSVPCLFYVMPSMSLAEILLSPSAPTISNEMVPLSLNLIFNPKDKGKWGGFKKALFGHTSCAALGPGDNTQICLKQCFYISEGSKKRHIYDNSRQILELEGEVKCLKWATALMKLVYDFINGEQKVRGNSPFDIPQLRFVKAALATAVGEKGAQTYLVEESIDEKTEGKFVKYISNDRAAPLPLASPESAHIAEFLAFAQHVQFHKTKKLAFVSDFQGVLVLSVI